MEGATPLNEVDAAEKLSDQEVEVELEGNSEEQELDGEADVSRESLPPRIMNEGGGRLWPVVLLLSSSFDPPFWLTAYMPESKGIVRGLPESNAEGGNSM